MTTPTPIKRADVPKAQTWNSESVFASWGEFQQELEAIAAQLPTMEAFKGRFGERPSVIADYLESYVALRRRVFRMLVFVRMANAVDNTDKEAKAKQGQLMSLMGRLSATVAFAEPELLAHADQLLTWADQEPRLNIYKHYFDNLLRQQPHLQTPEVEKVLGMLQDPFAGTYATYRELVNADMTFEPALDSEGESHKVALAIIPPIGIESPDRTLRRNAWNNFCDQHKALENTLASNLITSIKQNVFLARVRGYDSVLESRLKPANVPLAIFDNLINTFKDNLHVWHRYWAAKRNILGVDALHPYDIWAPIVKDEPTVTYQQAVDWICAGLEPLGADYVNVLRNGATVDRWVDWAQNEGRGQGAFSSGAYGSHPFVFNTFNERMMAMSVLAHELGHSMHSYMMDTNQPEIYNGYTSMTSSTVTETASNFHQAMVRAYLMTEKADDRTFQLALIDEAMFNFHRYFFIMPTLARFEQEVYARAENDQPLNATILNEIMSRVFAEGYGDTMTDDPERTATTWGQFLHLYMPFYSFQYSVGISAAHALAENILAGQDGAADRYLAFLGAGWSHYAPDLFKLAGVDMTEPEPIVKTFGVLEKLVERLESLV